jgi:ribosomal protein L11 methyltransferase
MNYTKISFKITPDTQENREILVAMLEDFAFESFDESNNLIMGYIPGDHIYSDWKDVFPLLPFSVQTETEIIPDKNWNEVWEKNYFEPLLIGNKCVIRAPFHTDFEKAELELVIEPKMAFGTGNHETTTLMAEQILEIDFSGKTVLDMGCGTGILGMLASLKGATKVTAIDIDSWSYESTMENAKLNHIQNIEAKLGNADLFGNERYDYIFANIHKNVILKDLPAYEKVLAPEGKIFLSGFYKQDIPDIKEKAESLELQEFTFKEKNLWVVYSFKKTK